MVFNILDLYSNVYTDILAVPVVKGVYNSSPTSTNPSRLKLKKRNSQAAMQPQQSKPGSQITDVAFKFISFFFFEFII
jgi:hypothetical protein